MWTKRACTMDWKGDSFSDFISSELLEPKTAVKRNKGRIGSRDDSVPAHKEMKEIQCYFIGN